MLACRREQEERGEVPAPVHRSACLPAFGKPKQEQPRLRQETSDKSRSRHKFQEHHRGRNKAKNSHSIQNQYANAIPALNPNAGPKRIPHGGLNSSKSTKRNSAGAR